MSFTGFSQLAGSHDLRLSAWGPYTKRYIGISHIPDVRAGLRFDLSVFPGLYRRAVSIPNVMWESGYHPWEAAPDLSYYRHRHELIWKDQVYCDIDFCRLDEGHSFSPHARGEGEDRCSGIAGAAEAVLIRAHCVNCTAVPQQLVLHYMASLHFPPVRTYSREPIRPCRVALPEGGLWVDALAYSDLHYTRFDPHATLSPDGQIRGEVRDHGFVDGQGLRFGEGEGDWVSYRIPVSSPLADADLLLRLRVSPGQTVRVSLEGLVGRELCLAGEGGFSLLRVPVGRVPGGEVSVTLISGGGAAIDLDGLALVPAGSEARFVPVTWDPVPALTEGPRADTLLLKYEQVDCHYGLAWGAGPYEVRQFACEELDSFMRHTVHNHTSRILAGPGEGHFTNVFIRPIFLGPHSERTIYGLVCSGNERAVRERLAAFDPTSPECDALHAQARSRAARLATTPAGEPYRFSQERMAATLLTNVVYPVRTRGTWIRHNTPGRWWDCLYTWDSGFIGLGLAELDLDRALDCLNAYVTEPGERDAAFIHHGSPVPVQFYLFLELWNRTRSRQLLEHYYPRLQQYHRFLAGRLGSSTTRTLPSNLLRTWDYFYNSGGWDDYPPQVYVHRNGLEASVTPVINTAQAIRTARILRMAALTLGEPTAEYEEDIAILAEALQEHAWDEESGYFGYVCHDAGGRPTGILRHEGGANFNMGLDGAYPLVAAVTTSAQEARLAALLMAEGRLWCRCGLSTVDQAAPYYRADGYWNGAVWMPHQWFFWKTLLDMGRADDAHRIAATALEVWQREVDESYNCFEHFIVETGRGAGWHHFGGLSSPVLCWYGAYHRPGRLSTGLDVWIKALEISANRRSLSADLRLFGPPHRSPVVIAALEPGWRYAATWNQHPAEAYERYPGVLEIRLPAGTGRGRLEISPAEG